MRDPASGTSPPTWSFDVAGGAFDDQSSSVADQLDENALGSFDQGQRLVCEALHQNGRIGRLPYRLLDASALHAEQSSGQMPSG